MAALANANLGLRFLLELGAVAAVAYWALGTGEGALRWLLAVAAAGAVILVWGLFVSPKRAIELPRPLPLAIELAVWAAAGAALGAAGRPWVGIAFFLVAVGSGVLNYAWH